MGKKCLTQRYAHELDINDFFLRLCEYFVNSNKSNISLVHNKSNFDPPSGCNNKLDAYIQYGI